MPDDTGFVQQIANAEKNGNFKEAFADALKFIYGDPSLLRTDGAGWRDRAQQLSTDLEKRHLIPPFKIVDGKGIEVNTEIPVSQTADGSWSASYASGLNIKANADFTSITVNDSTGSQPRIFLLDRASGKYVLEGGHSQILELTRTNTDHPTVTITDQQTVTTYTGDGTVTETRYGNSGEVLGETVNQANGLSVTTLGPPDNPQRKLIRYPDGTSIDVAASQATDAQGIRMYWSTTINLPNAHGGPRVYLTLQNDITDGNAQLPTQFDFIDPTTQIAYTIDNEALTVSLKKGTSSIGKYYMGGAQPDISNPYTTLPQPTATATASPNVSPENPFVPAPTTGAVEGNG